MTSRAIGRGEQVASPLACVEQSRQGAGPNKECKRRATRYQLILFACRSFVSRFRAFAAGFRLCDLSNGFLEGTFEGRSIAGEFRPRRTGRLFVNYVDPNDSSPLCAVSFRSNPRCGGRGLNSPGSIGRSFRTSPVQRNTPS